MSRSHLDPNNNVDRYVRFTLRCVLRSATADVLRNRRGGAVCCITLSVFVLLAASAAAQVVAPIYIRPAAGLPPVAHVIDAQARYVEAQGRFLVLAARAREINAQAVAQEIENWPKMVDAYFEGRKRNRDWREIERGGTYLQQLTRAEQVRAELMNTHFAELLRRDPVDALNWLLTELSEPTAVVQCVTGSDALRTFDVKLDKDVLKLMYVTDGGPGNSQIVFALGDPTPLVTPWPYLLRGDDFDELRVKFESARDALLREILAGGQASHRNGDRLIQATNDLLETLERTHPREARASPAVFLDYSAARSYLRSLVAQVHRVINTNDTAVFKGSLAFQGVTVLDLIEYMNKKGLVFHKGRREGSERAYRSLLMNMRGIYFTLGSETPPPAAK